MVVGGERPQRFEHGLRARHFLERDHIGPYGRGEESPELSDAFGVRGRGDFDPLVRQGQIDRAGGHQREIHPFEGGARLGDVPAAPGLRGAGRDHAPHALGILGKGLGAVRNPRRELGLRDVPAKVPDRNPKRHSIGRECGGHQERRDYDTNGGAHGSLLRCSGTDSRDRGAAAGDLVERIPALDAVHDYAAGRSAARGASP